MGGVSLFGDDNLTSSLGGGERASPQAGKRVAAGKDTSGDLFSSLGGDDIDGEAGGLFDQSAGQKPPTNQKPASKSSGLFSDEEDQNLFADDPLPVSTPPAQPK